MESSFVFFAVSAWGIHFAAYFAGFLYFLCHNLSSFQDHGQVWIICLPVYEGNGLQEILDQYTMKSQRFVDPVQPPARDSAEMAWTVGSLPTVKSNSPLKSARWMMNCP